MRRMINADDIMQLLAKYDSVSNQVHGITYQYMAHWHEPDDDVTLVIVLRGDDKTPGSLRETLGRATRQIIIRDAAAHFGAGVNDANATLVSAVLARALDQVSWSDVGNRVYQRTRERILGDAALAERADKRATYAAATSAGSAQ